MKTDKTEEKEAPEVNEKEELESNAEVSEENEVKEEKDELGQLQDELAEQKDKYIRLYSEFENFRRRTAKEKMSLAQTANEELMTALLPILDDIERAKQLWK